MHAANQPGRLSVVLDDPHFQDLRLLDLMRLTIVVSMLLIVPTAYWVHLRLPRCAVVEFITLLPFVIPAIVLVFGYLRLYNSRPRSSLTSNARAKTCC